MLNDIVIRPAKPEDMDHVIRLCHEHAAFEEAEIKSDVDWSVLSAHVFEFRDVQCLLAEHKNRVVGFATFMKQFSTWDASFYIYLDCLYLTEKVRGLGLGQELINEILHYASSQGCKLIQWQTPDFNESAIRFYHRIGAVAKNKKRFFLSVRN